MEGKEFHGTLNEKEHNKFSFTFKKGINLKNEQLKNISNTPPCSKSNFHRSILNQKKNDYLDFLTQEDEGTKLTQHPSLKGKSIKESRFAIQKVAASDSLCNKLPNFIENYENLMEIITHSKSEEVSPSLCSQKKIISKNIKNFDEENKKENIGNFITCIEKKDRNDQQTNKAHVIDEEEEKIKEERCIILKSLTNTQDIKDFYEDTEECLKRIVNLKVTPIEDIEHLRFNLPFEEELKHKRLAVFDLDETLVHCEIKNPKRGEFQIKVKLPSGAITQVGLNIRPLIKEALEEIQKNYLIIVYTASHQSYADSVLNFLDPEEKFIKYRLYRNNCVKVPFENSFIYIKDMRIFKNVNPKDIIVIDNTILSFAFQLENGIPILPFYNNKDDEELSFLTNYLTRISKTNDLRKEIKKSFKMDYFMQAASNNAAIDLENGIGLEIYEGNKSSNGKDDVLTLNMCNNKNESDILDSSINASMNCSFAGDEISGEQIKERQKKLTYKFSDNSVNRNSKIQDELINTLVEFKKNLEGKYTSQFPKIKTEI